MLFVDVAAAVSLSVSFTLLLLSAVISDVVVVVVIISII